MSFVYFVESRELHQHLHFFSHIILRPARGWESPIHQPQSRQSTVAAILRLRTNRRSYRSSAVKVGSSPASLPELSIAWFDMQSSMNTPRIFPLLQSLALTPYRTRSRECLVGDVRQLHAVASLYAGHNRVSLIVQNPPADSSDVRPPILRTFFQWSKIRHRKGAADAAKSSQFSKVTNVRPAFP